MENENEQEEKKEKITNSINNCNKDINLNEEEIKEEKADNINIDNENKELEKVITDKRILLRIIMTKKKITGKNKL